MAAFLILVPSAPADIKAAVSSRNKILVSWLPPASPNGVLVGYTLYMSVIEDGREVCYKNVISRCQCICSCFINKTPISISKTLHVNLFSSITLHLTIVR